VPGLNDGPHLARTVTDLTELYQWPVASIGIVPVGLTRYHQGKCRTYTRDESAAILDQLKAWRRENREKRGCAFVYPSDEWYLVAGRDVPQAPEYDGFPQVENGVGMVRQLLDEWQALRDGVPDLSPRSVTLVCGTLIAPVMARIVEELSRLTGTSLHLEPVVNQFFGPVTTVSGLLTGVDVVSALQKRSLGEVVLLPRAMFTGRYGAGSSPPGMALDDMALTDIAEQLGVRVEVAGTLAEVLGAIK